MRDGSQGNRQGPIARRVMVTGRVQGIGFRQACADAARRRGLAGWVRNRRDGRVEALFQGPPTDVAALVGWCRTGPPAAVVRTVDVAEQDPEPVAGFRVAATE